MIKIMKCLEDITLGHCIMQTQIGMRADWMMVPLGGGGRGGPRIMNHSVIYVYMFCMDTDNAHDK